MNQAFFSSDGRTMVSLRRTTTLDRLSESTAVEEVVVRAGEVEHGQRIAAHAEAIWNWASPAGKLRARRRAELILEAAKLQPDMRVLELGCGTGLFTRMFAKSGAHIVAIDVSPALLECAIERLPHERIEFRVDDAECLSFDDGSFDAVIGSSVLHHLDVEQALQEVHRVLKPGGRIAFAEPNMMNPQIALQRHVPGFRRWARESPEETAFLRWRLSVQLGLACFDMVRIEPFDFLHPAVPRPLIPMVQRLGGVLERFPLLREIAGSLILSAHRKVTDTRSVSRKTDRENRLDNPVHNARVLAAAGSA